MGGIVAIQAARRRESRGGARIAQTSRPRLEAWRKIRTLPASALLVGLLTAPVLGIVTWVAPVVAQEPTSSVDLAEEAELLFRRGVLRYQARDFAGAIEYFLASNRLVPNGNVGLNIAQCYEQLGDFPQAFRHYADYLDGADIPADGRTRVEASLARLRPRVALLRVETSPLDATVYVDRRDLGARGTTPRVLALPAGPHRVIVTRVGHHDTRSDEVTLSIGAETVVTLALRPIVGRARIEGTPIGAEVRVDSDDAEVVARLPATLELTPGSHVLVISAPGHASLRQPVVVRADQTTRARVALDRRAGTVLVDASERDARVEIDGRLVGLTPAVATALSEGRHWVRVTLDGYEPVERRVEVSAERPTRVFARLDRIDRVTAAARTAQRVDEAPASVSLISRQEIEAFGYQSIAEALSGTRGVIVTDDRVTPFLGVRGFARLGSAGSRVLTTLDGHTLNDDLRGSASAGFGLLTDLEDVERIEVVRGPGSVVYGTNAFSGVVNVATRDPRTSTAQPGPWGSVAAFGAGGARLRLGVRERFGEHADIALSVGGVFAQGDDLRLLDPATCKPPLPEGCDGIARTSRDANGMLGGSVLGRARFRDFTLEAAYGARRQDVATGGPSAIIGDLDAALHESRGFIELRWAPRIAGRVTLNARVYLDGSTTRDDEPILTDRGFASFVRRTIARTTWSGLWGGVEPRVTWAALPWLSLTAGAEARTQLRSRLTSTFDGGTMPTLSPGVTALSLYAGADAKPGRWLAISAGARLDSFTTFGAAVSPRAALILRPSRRDVVKLLVGTAFRAPSLAELNLRDSVLQIPPVELQRERVFTAELEASHRVSSVLTSTVSIYLNEIRDLIELSLVPAAGGFTVRQYRNTPDTVRTLGVEYELSRRWRDRFLLSAAYAFQHTRTGDLFGDREITNAPEGLLSLKVAGAAIPRVLVLASRLVVETSRLTVAGARTEIPVLWDLTVSGEISSLRLRYTVGVRNVFDRGVGQPGGPEIRIDQVPQQGRTFFLALTLTL